jgi:hypothetical protein
MRNEGDIAHQNEFLVARDPVEHAFRRLLRVLAIAGEQFLVRPGDAQGSITQTLPVRVVAGPGDERADRRLSLLPARAARRLVGDSRQVRPQFHDFIHNDPFASWGRPAALRLDFE